MRSSYGLGRLPCGSLSSARGSLGQILGALAREQADHSSDEDAELHAKRLVAQRCLYGVDKNPLATDLAKLSLWLATLAKEHPFTFLDHSLRAGDSLVGLT